MYSIFSDWITWFALASIALMVVTVFILFWISRPRTELYKDYCTHRFDHDSGQCMFCGMEQPLDDWLEEEERILSGND